MPDSQLAHEIGQVDGPDTLGQLQLPARLLKVLLAHWVQVPATADTPVMKRPPATTSSGAAREPVRAGGT